MAGKPDEPIILRDLLTQQNVIDALEQAGASKPATGSAASTNAADPASATVN